MAVDQSLQSPLGVHIASPCNTPTASGAARSASPDVRDDVWVSASSALTQTPTLPLGLLAVGAAGFRQLQSPFLSHLREAGLDGSAVAQDRHVIGKLLQETFTVHVHLGAVVCIYCGAPASLWLSLCCRVQACSGGGSHIPRPVGITHGYLGGPSGTIKHIVSSGIPWFSYPGRVMIAG